MKTFNLPDSNPTFLIEFFSLEEFEVLTSNYLNTSIWCGKVEEISEELCDQVVNKMLSNNPPDQEIKFRGEFYDYSNYCNYCKSAKESFQTLSDLPYCVINKIE